MERKVKVTIDTIDHELQRYDTCGDWQWHTGAGHDALKISVSRLYNFRQEFLIAIHELVEAVLCSEQGVKEQDVDEFDKSFTGPGDAGDSLLAPYHSQHLIATAVEKYLSVHLKVDWAEYEGAIKRLNWKPKAVDVSSPQFCQWCGAKIGAKWPHASDCPRPKS